jgi:uncharacterized protein (TIGR02147 family)
MSVYEYNDSLDYLKDCIEQNRNRGFHGQLAKAAGMHPSYLSRILHGSIHLTPDQAAGLCNFWNFDRDETNYFLNLVHLTRAGTPTLRKILENDLKAIRVKHEDLGALLPAEKIDLQKENLYYSAWYYCAVHVLLTIPNMQTETAISEKLNLPLFQVRKILASLEALNLVKKTSSKWQPTKNNVHLTNESWMAAIHHIHWRMKISDRIQFRNPEDLHYTGVHTLSRSDFKKIKNLLLETLVKVDKVVRPSTEEELCSLLIDWCLL